MNPAASEDEVTLRDLWRVMLGGKRLIIGFAAAFAAIGVAYVLIAPPWYEAEVLLAPADERSTEDSLTSTLGGLVGLAGITIGGEDNSEAIAIVESRDFTRAFIHDLNLMPVLYAEEWDASAGNWKDSDPESRPDMREAVRYFDEKIRRVEEDKSTNLVTIKISWKDGVLAAQWANTLVQRLNAAMRQRALGDAERNFAYLQKELEGASIVTLQQSIGRLLDVELQKLMLARGNEEFAFRVLDQAESPQWPARPRRVLVPILMLLLGGLLGTAFVAIRHALSAPDSR